MKKLLLVLILLVGIIYPQQLEKETAAQKDARMQWWRQARFGMFIHWGLYSIPAGEWNGETKHAEWIRETAQIPLEKYNEFVSQFNPVKFNADEWVKMAKDAGMKYIVITSKHHDGFCLFDSKYTDFDVMSTPFKRDILKEMADACRKYGIKMCFYHSIMDWHHPDYLPRRGWETSRTAEGADFNRYVAHLKNQLKEIITNYGDIGVLWFDGEWENTWTKDLGDSLYAYVRSLDKNIIVNNRVSKGRAGMNGFTTENGGAGDFGTPEQQIPATGFPGIDWESCITMNDNWGYNKADKNFKSTKELLRMVVDIASKGGNLLLNIGPKADGAFPDESIERLKGIGKWMQVYGEAIYSTQASPFDNIPWGRCTQKPLSDNNTRLYLHVFDWPANGKLFLYGLANETFNCSLLSDNSTLTTVKIDNGTVINLPRNCPDSIDCVIALDIKGKPEIFNTPSISTEYSTFVDKLEISINSPQKNVEVKYATEKDKPLSEWSAYIKPFTITESASVFTALFKNGKIVSEITEKKFTKVEPEPAAKVSGTKQGVNYKYYEGKWDKLPDFSALRPINSGTLTNFIFTPKKAEDYFAFEYSGYINIPQDGMYTFYIASDDGSKLLIDNKVLIDNDGKHGLAEKEGLVALQAGMHPISVSFFDYTGEEILKVSFKAAGGEKLAIPDELLFCK